MNRKFTIKENYMFSKIFKKGKYAANNFVVVYVLANYNKNAPSKLGISASVKNGGAVQRNRAKRVVREAYYKIYGKLPNGYLIVVSARPPCFDRKNKMGDVYKAMLAAFYKLKLIGGNGESVSPLPES